MSSQEEIWRWLCQQLDVVGYSLNMAQQRRKHYRELSCLYSYTCNIKLILSGSRGDGLTRALKSDSDVLLHIQHYIFKTKPYCLQVVPSGETVFTITNCHFGYCTLELWHPGIYGNLDIENSLVPLNGKRFLSSRLFRLEKTRQSKPRIQRFNSVIRSSFGNVLPKVTQTVDRDLLPHPHL